MIITLVEGCAASQKMQELPLPYIVVALFIISAIGTIAYNFYLLNSKKR